MGLLITVMYVVLTTVYADAWLLQHHDGLGHGVLALLRLLHCRLRAAAVYARPSAVWGSSEGLISTAKARLKHTPGKPVDYNCRLLSISGYSGLLCWAAWLSRPFLLDSETALHAMQRDGSSHHAGSDPRLVLGLLLLPQVGRLLPPRREHE